MKQRNRALAALTLLTAGALGTTQPASAASTISRGDVSCRGSINGGIARNVTVPEGATCVLDRVLVTGSVTIQARSTTKVTRAVVRGNITASGEEYDYTGPTSTTVDHTVVAGDIVAKNSGSVTVNRSTAHSVTGHSNFYGLGVALNDTAVARDVDIAGFPYTSFYGRRIAVGGAVKALGSGAHLEKSYVRGATVLDADGVSVCGSHLADLKVDPTYGAYLGTTDACGGNVIRGNLVVGAAENGFAAYNNVVHGHATSPVEEPRFAEDGVQGGNNRFLGGVTGYLSKLTGPVDDSAAERLPARTSSHH